MRLLACLALLLSTSTALAEGEPERCAPPDTTIPLAVHVEYRDGQKIVVIDPEIVLCGHPPRPNVAYVHTAKTIHYEWETLRQDFLPAILGSLEKGPF